MEKFLKNLDYAKVLTLASQVEYLPGQVVSKTLAQGPAFGLTLFAMPEGEGISAHKSSGDAFVLVLEGKCKISIEDEKYSLEAGKCIVMPAGRPHAVAADGNFKMLLIVVFPPQGKA